LEEAMSEGEEVGERVRAAVEQLPAIIMRVLEDAAPDYFASCSDCYYGDGKIERCRLIGGGVYGHPCLKYQRNKANAR
jgi:hypothetical protein